MMIFIGGVHGVGKTSFGAKVAERFSIKAYSASELISKLKHERFSHKKRALDIDGNQDYLVAAIRELEKVETNYLLDGHFCLLDSLGTVYRVPANTFEELCPQALIVLFDSPKRIADRLSIRDGVQHEVSEIEAFQKEELRYAQEISERLGIPFLAVDNSESLCEAYSFIEKILAG